MPKQSLVFQPIVLNLASDQDYPGSNNVPLLQAIGQYGTRATGGKDAAAARYLFTKLSPVTPLLFRAADAPVLKYSVEVTAPLLHTHRK